MICHSYQSHPPSFLQNPDADVSHELELVDQAIISDKFLIFVNSPAYFAFFFSDCAKFMEKSFPAHLPA